MGLPAQPEWAVRRAPLEQQEWSVRQELQDDRALLA